MSFTSFHPESWSIAWNVEKMLLALISFMYTNEDTTGSIRTSYGEKQKLALESLDFNLKNKDFVQTFKPFFPSLQINNEMKRIVASKQEIVSKEKEENSQRILFLVVSFLLIILVYVYIKY